MQKLLTIRDIDVKNKTVFVRASFDVPLDSTKSLLDPKRIRDDSRIRDAVPTLSYLLKNNAKIILEGGWLGRPKGEDPDLSMAPVALRLQEMLKEEGLLKHPVLLTPNCLDGSKPRSVYKNKEEVKRDVSKLKDGQVILLENVRYDTEANANDQKFAEFMASLAGNNAIYVNEAEAQNHRPEATITSVPILIAKNGGKAVFGFKVAEVIKYLGNISKLLDKKQRGPFIFFLSGKKIETQIGITSKITVTHALLDKMKEGDIIIVQGAVTYTFLIAEEYLDVIGEKYTEMEKIMDDYNKKIKEQSGKQDKDSSEFAKIQESLQKEKSDKLKEIIGLTDNEIKYLIGNSFVEWKEIGEQVMFAAQLCIKARSKKVIVMTNLDHTITNKFPDKFGNLPKDAEIKAFNSAVGIPEGWLGVAPGPKTLDVLCKNAKSAYMLILAGPLSIEEPRVEQFSRANKKLFDAIKEAKSKGAITIAAGGDTAAVVRAYNGEDAFTVISNAGGATLELIEKDGRLPGIDSIENAIAKDTSF